MKDFTFEFDEDLASEAEATGGSFGVLDTGMYAVTINFASVSKTENGNTTLSLDITTEDGHNTTLWNVFGTIDKVWKSGSENFGYKNFQAFMAVNGIKSFTQVPYALKKDDGTLIKNLTVVKELQGKKCKLVIQKVLDVYNLKNAIHSSYNEKGQTYLEMKDKAPAEKIYKVAERIKDKETKEYKLIKLNSSPAQDDRYDEADSIL